MTIKRLPKPLAIYSGKSVVFEVYRAKDLFKGSWVSSKLRSLVIATRRAYNRYGKRPPLDKCDKKAVIYLVRARYRVKKLPVEEWLSVRMVPGDGSFLGVKEPEIFYYKDKPIDYWLKKRMGSGSKADFWKQVVSSSRMCGINPFYEKWRSGELSERHKYTGASFAIIHAQFLIDYPIKSFPYRYITATIRDDLLHKGLGVKTKRKIVLPFFLPAYKLLGIPRSGVRVNREVYAYDFPSYWLNSDHMKAVVRNLIKDGTIRGRSFIKNPFELIKSFPRGSNPGKKELLKIVDEKVDDAAELKITPAKQWYRGMRRVLNAAGVAMPKFLTTFRKF